MDLCNESCSYIRPSILRGKVGHYTQTVKPNFFMFAMLTDSFILLSLTMTWNKITKFSIDLNGIWCTIETHYCHEPYIYFILSI